MKNSNQLTHDPIQSRKLLADRDGIVSNLAVVIVTWQDHAYTAACIYSLLNSTLRPRLIVVVDNGSTDHTSRFLHEFLESHYEIKVRDPFNSTDTKLNAQIDAASYYYIASDEDPFGMVSEAASNKTLIKMISASENGGFARGNNIGIQYLRKIKYEGCLWMLNNDAYVAPNCIEEIVSNSVNNLLPDLFGTALVDYYNPSRVQALGGTVSGPWLSPKNNFSGEIYEHILSKHKEIDADYPIGASMLTWTELLFNRDQPLFEGYFLYYEELDLCADLELTSCKIFVNSVVAHVGGAATGDAASVKNKTPSLARDYFGTRSRVIFCKRHTPQNIGYLYIFFGALLFKRLFSLKLKNSSKVFRGFFDGLAFASK